MSGRVTNETASLPALRLWPAAWCAVVLARLLALLPPVHLRRALVLARRGARPATAAEAGRARDAVVATSVRCTGQWCLQRSIATALLCRMAGTWPTWRTGVRTQPFGAHAWVEAEGVPVGENLLFIKGYRILLTVE